MNDLIYNLLNKYPPTRSLYITFVGKVVFIRFDHENHKIILKDTATNNDYSINGDGTFSDGTLGEDQKKEVVLFPSQTCRSWKKYERINLLKINDVLLVSDDGENWVLRRFHSVSDGKIKVISNGLSSTTSGYLTTAFMYNVPVDWFDFNDISSNIDNSL